MTRALLFRFLLVTASIAAAVTVTPRPAVADDASDAIQHIKDANTAYDKGDFRTALISYRKAYELTEDPRLLYRIGLTYENLANYKRAREHLELYLLQEPDSKYAGRIKVKIENLRKLESSLQAVVTVESEPEGARVFVDGQIGKALGTTPLRVPVGPGEHTITLKKEGYALLEDTVAVESGQTIEKTYQLQETEDGAATDTEPEAPDEVADADAGDGEETGETSSPAPPRSPGQMTQVDIAPPVGVSILAWSLVIPGFILASASFLPQSSNQGLILLSGGTLAFLGGGYLLWFHDWTSDLPPAGAAPRGGPQASDGFGIGVGFDF